MRAVVTGGSGFIGARVVARLRDEGACVRSVDVVPGGTGCDEIRASVLDLPALAQAFDGSDVVVHLAGYARDRIRREPFEGGRLHLQGTLNVIEACRMVDLPRLVFASTFYVYEGLPLSRVVDEETPLDLFRMELFAATKLMGESMCRDFARTGGPSPTLLRFGSAYGPGGSNAVTGFIDSALEGRPLEVWGRGDRPNQFTLVDDLADGVVRALDHEGGTYNLIAPEVSTTADLAALVAEQLGTEVVFDHNRPEGPRFPRMSARRAVEELGWNPTSLRDGVHTTIERMTSDRSAFGAGDVGTRLFPGGRLARPAAT